MKCMKTLPLILGLLMMLDACSIPDLLTDVTTIQLSDDGILVDGNPVETDFNGPVYQARDIVYYESGKDFTYGEGTDADAHSPEDAAGHIVVHVTQPGVYTISGKLSKGQIAVDLGKDAKDDPNAVVTLILDGVDITCEVAPAVIFYNVYECGDAEKASKDVDTSNAGANVVIADGSENHICGSYVARIYKPDSVELNEAGTKVEEAKKLHKYDGAFYSKMSMNVSGDKEGTGVLNIYAENEGLDTELHLTINGGNINIFSGNDGINTNEDGISVTTINGGILTIQVTGDTGEGDGIDSNGWLVIRGGTVIAAACSDSMDAGIDSDMGIHINGGTVIACGNMLDRIEDGGQTYAVFSFSEKQYGTEEIQFRDAEGKALLAMCPDNDYSVLIFSSSDLKPDRYTLWSGSQQLAGQTGGMMGGPGVMPGGMMPPEETGDFQPPEGMSPPDGETPPGGQMPPDGKMPEERPNIPNGDTQGPGNGFKPDWNQGDTGEVAVEFVVSNGANMFNGIVPAV